MSAIPKPTRWRSEKYLKWVRQQPCIICGNTPAEPHHIKGVGHLSGMGLKADDVLTCALCRTCHEEMHDTPNAWAHQYKLICETILKAVRGNILTVR